MFPFLLLRCVNFNLSYDSLEGRVPIILKNYGFEVFIGNKDLCSDITGFAQCPSPSLISPSTPPLAPENIVSRMEDGTEKDEHSNFKKKKNWFPSLFSLFLFHFITLLQLFGYFLHSQCRVKNLVLPIKTQAELREQKMGTCSQYGIIMAILHLKTSLKS